MTIVQKIGKRLVDDGQHKIRRTPIENSFNLASMLRIALSGRNIGAYILQKGTGNFIVQFGWECKGIHSTLCFDEIDPVFDALSAGLKDLPDNERLTIHLSSFTDDTERQKNLAKLADRAPSLANQYRNVLKRCYGLRRCLYYGEIGFERWLGWSVIAGNLAVMSRTLAKANQRRP
jgi:hypothetical protein